MKIIKDKKLFGLINIVDILLILIIAVGAFFGYKILFKGDSTSIGLGQKYTSVKYTVRLDNLPEGVSEYINIGDLAYDNETNAYVGKVVSFTSGEFLSSRENNINNEFVLSSIPLRETVYLTIEVDVSDQGADLITANNYYIKVGKPMSVRAGRFAGDGFVSYIERLDLENNTVLENKTVETNSANEISGNSGENIISGEEVYECKEGMNC